jgi:predicted TIM-barrel fold metal-dependent hydrolase
VSAQLQQRWVLSSGDWPLLRVRVRPRLEVVAENNAHIHSPERVGLDPHDTQTQRGGYVPGPRRVTPPGNHQGGVDQRISVAQEYHIQLLPAECARSRAGGALLSGAVEHLDRDAALRSDLDDRLSYWFRLRPHDHAARYEEEHARCA